MTHPSAPARVQSLAKPPALLQAVDVHKHYPLPRISLWQSAPVLQAVRGVSFELQAGKTLGIVGESGSGKSTLARLCMALEPPTAGDILFRGSSLQRMGAAELRAARPGFQMVFQDPFGSLDPRQTVLRIVTEPLEVDPRIAKGERLERAQDALQEVGLRSADLAKYPHEFSGGQRQRIAIARALITRPALIVADEPVSALDVSVQAQVLNLMLDLQERYGLSYLFISHDLAVVNLMADDILVLQHGQVVEHGSAQTVLSAPAHPYTQKLLAAVPGPQR